MEVELIYFGEFRDITGIRQENLSLKEGARLSDALEVLKGRYGDDFISRTRMENNTVLVEGQFYGLVGGEEAGIKDGITICFLPIMHGG